MFEFDRPKYQNLPGLVAQILSAQRGRPHGRRRLSVGDAMAAAEKVYSGEWHERVVKRSTARAAHRLVSTRRSIVDNAPAGAITKAA